MSQIFGALLHFSTVKFIRERRRQRFKRLEPDIRYITEYWSIGLKPDIDHNAPTLISPTNSKTTPPQEHAQGGQLGSVYPSPANA